jgi:copper chaperone CopZ
MKRSRTFPLFGFGVLVFALFVSAFQPQPHDRKVGYYTIESPFCSGCVSGIRSTVGEIEGVEAVKVDVEKHTIIVTFDAATITPEALADAIVEASTFKVSLREVKDAEADTSGR